MRDGLTSWYDRYTSGYGICEYGYTTENNCQIHWFWLKDLSNHHHLIGSTKLNCWYTRKVSEFKRTKMLLHYYSQPKFTFCRHAMHKISLASLDVFFLPKPIYTSVGKYLATVKDPLSFLQCVNKLCLLHEDKIACAIVVLFCIQRKKDNAISATFWY